MNISAASDYGIRAALELAKLYTQDPERLATTQEIATAQKIPTKFLEALIRKLKEAMIVESRRGLNGGHKLSLNPNKITVADVIRAIDGPLAAVKGERPESLKYLGSAKHLTDVWIAVRSSLRAVLEEVTLAEVLSGKMPSNISKSISQPGAWSRR
ncbi:MAG: RrF2 family transcriptional regulator [Candidatus Nanopelagicaceae bacterium]